MLPSVRVTLFLFVTVGLGFGLIAKYFPIVIGGNLTVGHLYLVALAITLLVCRKSRFIQWLTKYNKERI